MTDMPSEEIPEGMSEVPAQLPPLDPGNVWALDPKHEIQITRGFVRLQDGRTVYVLTFRQGVCTFTLPFHGGPQAMIGMAQMLLSDAEKTERPSGLIVPQPGTPIPDLRRKRG